MKKLLLLPILAIMFVGCYNDDFDRIDGDINKLKADLAQSDINNAALVAALQERAAADLAAAEARVAELAASLTTQAQSVLDAAIATLNADIAEVEADIDILNTAVLNQGATDTSLADAIAALETALDALEDDLEDLEDDLDDLEGDQLSVTIGNWAPEFELQLTPFTQFGDSLIDGVVVNTDVASRTINIGTTTSTITVNSFEHAQTPVIDVNTDRDHADAIRATYIQTVYTATVSGTNEVVGTRTATPTTINWIVVNNN